MRSQKEAIMRLYDGGLFYCQACGVHAYMDEAAVTRLESLTGSPGQKITSLDVLNILHRCCDNPRHGWVVASDMVDISSLVPSAKETKRSMQNEIKSLLDEYDETGDAKLLVSELRRVVELGLSKKE